MFDMKGKPLYQTITPFDMLANCTRLCMGTLQLLYVFDYR